MLLENLTIFSVFTFIGDNSMSTKTKQKKMSDFVSTTESTKKRATDTAYSSEPKRAKFGQVDLSCIDFSCKKKNAKGKSYNLKIMTWNVAGLRAWIKVINYKHVTNTKNIIYKKRNHCHFYYLKTYLCITIIINLFVLFLEKCYRIP